MACALPAGFLALMIVVGVLTQRSRLAADFSPAPPSTLQTDPAASSPNPASSASSQGLEMVESRTVSEEYGRYIVGTVRNTSNHVYDYVQVEANLYDTSGAQVGSTLANVNNLEPGGTWKFKAIIMEPNVVQYKITKVSGY
jgi:hypothetical protein